jgi:hypothetical protein
LKKTKFTGMKHGVSKWLSLCSKCTETHLRASVVKKNFLGLISLAMRGGEKGREGEGRGKRGRKAKGGEGKGGKGRGGKD